MRRIYTYLLLLSLLPALVSGEDFPARSTTLVSDFAEILTPEQRQALETKLVAFNDSTSSQLAVVIMRSTGGYDISEYSVQLFNKWGIGQKKENNGILLLVATADRKVFITTGYGIEGVLPDGLCGRIIRYDVLPRFKSGDYYGGIDAATTSIMGIVKGEFTAENYRKNKGEKGFPLYLFFLALFIIFIVITSTARRTRHYAQTNNLSFWAAWALLNAASN
ncbi:MAG: TPM domain-containing protein, partial [Bacteroidota bacterium]